ncbi:MAG TPA: ferrous iron transport protein B [Clostridiales bacterium]|nr:ferrous iron transport protein B [Clostridiales bacterium]
MSLRIALAGNPNSGKTTLFNILTGSRAHVGNWPGVTVDRREGTYKSKKGEANIIDLPGIYSLSPYTPEEVVARNYIIDEKPDMVINIVDATNLERNLYLTTQLLELDCPLIVALNMTDLLEKEKNSIDASLLEKRLGVPVFSISALRGTGVKEMMEGIMKLAGQNRQGNTVLKDGPLADAFLAALKIVEEKKLSNPVFHAVKLLENDSLTLEAAGLTEESHEVATVQKLVAKANELGDGEAAVADERYKSIAKKFVPALKKSSQAGLNTSDKVDKVLTNRILGLPIFLGLMWLVFHLTFGEFLFGIEPIPTPGTLLVMGIEWLFDWVNEGALWLMDVMGAAEGSLTYGLIIDGVFAGVGAVLGFLPLVVILFFFLSLLEETGYMARVAFIMDRMLRRFGLSGKAFVPMLMGFGCSVPAIMGVRTLENDRDRKLTMMLIPWMSCGAKFPIYGVFAAALFEENADLMTFGLYLIGIVTAVLAGVILKKTVFKGDAAPFIMEMPAYHRPRAKGLFLQVWDKAKGYLVRAGTVILASTIVIWFLANFSFSLRMVEANSAESILGVLGNGIRFFFIPLGFASGPDGWKAVVAILTGLVAKEMVVSTMGVLYNPGIQGDALEDEGAQAALIASISASFTPVAALAFMAFNLLSVPCMAAVGALRSEMRSRKWFWFTILLWIAAAWIVSFAINIIGTGLNSIFHWF